MQPGARYWLVGASEGLGRALAHKLSARGIELALSARNGARLAALAEGLPQEATVHPLDVRDSDAVLHRISYHINSKNPKRVTNVNGTGSQQYRIKYSDYEQDQNENWVSRKVVTTYRRGDKEGSDTRKIEYFEPED